MILKEPAERLTVIQQIVVKKLFDLGYAPVGAGAELKKRLVVVAAARIVRQTADIPAASL